MGKIDEKAVLPQTHVVDEPAPAPPAKGRRVVRTLAFALGVWLLVRLCLLPILYPSWSPYDIGADDDTPSSSCAQAEPVVPQAFDTSELITGNEGRIREWLSGAVRVPTEVFDVMGEIDEDPRWDVFYKFSECEHRGSRSTTAADAQTSRRRSLWCALSEVKRWMSELMGSHQHLTRSRVNTHALVFEWIGSDPSLKPLLLTGHQGASPGTYRRKWGHC